MHATRVGGWQRCWHRCQAIIRALRSRSLADRVAQKWQRLQEPETDHPAERRCAPDAEPIDVARAALQKLVSGAINAAKASALEDADLAASLRICTLDGVAAHDDDGRSAFKTRSAQRECSALRHGGWRRNAN